MPKIEFTEQEKKEQKAKVEKTKKKSGRPFKVTGHVAQHEILQNSIFKHLLGDNTRAWVWPGNNWTVDDFVWFLYDTRFIKNGGRSSARFYEAEIVNEIKILANEGKIELGKQKVFRKRTVKIAPGFVWCNGCKEYEWHELLSLRGC